MDDRQPDPAGWTAQRESVWVELQPMLDRLFLPFEKMLADMIVAANARDVLDIGCGAGATTLAIAQRLGARGSCTGVVISEALVVVARRRAIAAGRENAHFLCADAQRHPLAPASHDAVVSRFGVMFFDDPVAAFANIRRTLRPDGMLACIGWRGAQDNSFMPTSEQAIAEVLGPQPSPAPDAPGQFAFAEDRRVRRILAGAGWDAIDIQPIRMSCELTTAELPVYARRMGRAGTVLPNLEKQQRMQLKAALDAKLARFVVDDLARFDAACWMVRAQPGCRRNPGDAPDR